MSSSERVVLRGFSWLSYSCATAESGHVVAMVSVCYVNSSLSLVCYVCLLS